MLWSLIMKYQHCTKLVVTNTAYACIFDLNAIQAHGRGMDDMCHYCTNDTCVSDKEIMLAAELL